MAVQFKVSGTVLFKGSGTVALDADCCCGTNFCDICSFSPARLLYLTIDNFTLNGGETCDDDCAGYSVTAKENFGGTQSSPCGINWFTENCGDDGNFIISVSTLASCSGDPEQLAVGGVSSGYGWIIDNCMDNNIQCYIAFADSLCGTETQPLGVPVCDPFYIQATVDIILYDPDGTTQCGTGTMRITITE